MKKILVAFSFLLFGFFSVVVVMMFAFWLLELPITWRQAAGLTLLVSLVAGVFKARK